MSLIVDLSDSDNPNPELSQVKFKEIIEYVLEDASELTGWEYDFLLNLADVEDVGELTTGQTIKILEIAEKIDV